MNTRCTLWILVALPAVASQAQTFTVLSPLAEGVPAEATAISANGRFATGWYTDQATALPPACVWNAAGAIRTLPMLGDAVPVYKGWGVSDDGTVVAGESSGMALLWGGGGGGGGDVVIGEGAAQGLTPDASVSVGYLVGDGHLAAFRRSASGTLTPLTPLPGHADSVAQAISPDGRWVVGTSIDNTLPESVAVVWHDGVVTPLEPAFIYYLAVGNDISDDGSVVVGSAGSLDGVSVAVRWVNGVADPFILSNFGNARGCSADGRIIVGETVGGAFVWDPVNGERSLSSILTAAGIDLTGLILSSATGVSADGTVIVGQGFDEGSGQPFAWRARLVAECAADFNGDGFLDFFDYDDYVAAFESGQGPAADFNSDGFIDFFDYDGFVEAFEEGC